jgi:hypothetical protein
VYAKPLLQIVLLLDACVFGGLRTEVPPIDPGIVSDLLMSSGFDRAGCCSPR